MQLPHFRHLSKRAITISLLLMTLCLSFPSFSQEATIKENSPEVHVKYLDGDNEALLFNLKYDNESGNNFKLMVLGENGDILFQRNYSGRRFRKNIRLARLTDTDGVIFVIRSVNENVQLSRKVKVTSKVEDVSEEL
jgi:hypothetical protein